MGLMDGLSHWLRQIIAVVLLASLIDLILPNRTMQRYVRLVAGLFILMTVATPIMQWMKGDFSSRLSESLNTVEFAPQRAADELALIEEEGAKLRDKRNVQAADLVTTRLEAAIRKEVEQAENRSVQKVDVITKRESDGSLTVTKVSILFEPEPDTEASSVAEVADVEPIAAVDIQIEVDSWPEKQEGLPAAEASASKEAAEGEEASDKETQLRISTLIASRFGLAAHIIDVKQHVPVTNDSN